MAEPVATLVAESCLAPGGRVFSDTLRLSVLPPRVTIRLQVGLRSLKTVGAIRVAERPLPLAPCSWSGDDPVFCRIAPDAWLIQSALHAEGDLLQAVRRGCGRRSFVVTDVSDSFVTIAIDGSLATALLARGCTLDLAFGAFGSGACARTRLAQLPVVLRRAASDRFECLVDRAVAQYLHDWLVDAAMAVAPPDGSAGMRRA